MEVNITPKMAQTLIEALKREEELQKQKQGHQKAIYKHLDRINANNFSVRVRLIKIHLQEIDKIDNAEI